MNIKQIKELHDKFNNNLDINYRISALKKFSQAIHDYEEALYNGLYLDLGKNKKEAFLCEINESLEEINHHVSHLKKWAKPKKVKSSYQVFGCKSKIIKKPKGKVLLIAPFNYPVNLTFLPLIGAISAGNKVLIKLSSQTPNTNKVIKQIIDQAFEQHHVVCLIEPITDYMSLFDYEPNMLFFTGSTNVGKGLEKICVEKNIEYITEMGGMCPCIAYDIDNLSYYDRIVWAKFLNAGQTCVSINYILFNKNIENFIPNLINTIKKQFPEPLTNFNIPKLINKKAFERIKSVILENEENIVFGGNFNEERLIVEPTIIKTSIEKIKEYGEIFGPILFISELNNDFNKYIESISKIDNSPLAAYLFSKNNDIRNKFMTNINAGGYCYNDALSHITNHHLPFGGVYTSGFGQYHGHYSFEAFSFSKPLLINDNKKNINIKFVNNHIDLEKTKKLFKIIRKIVK